MAKNPNFNRYKSEGPKPPCVKDCPGRKAGCAIDCEKWAAYVVERDKTYKKRVEDMDRNMNTAQRDRVTDTRAAKKKNNSGWF